MTVVTAPACAAASVPTKRDNRCFGVIYCRAIFNESNKVTFPNNLTYHPELYRNILSSLLLTKSNRLYAS
jgi:hypothetical protein